MPLFTRPALALCCAVLLGLASAATALAAPVETPQAAETIQKANLRAQQRAEKRERKISDTVVSVAKQYVGFPYAWGGASPAGFDCSGFTAYVYRVVLGVSLPHDQLGQLASGRPVGADELKPGDLLIFQNTYKRGPSHNGIYLGDGRFIHAVDQRFGVTISVLGSAYWGPRFYGASRLAPASRGT